MNITKVWRNQNKVVSFSGSKDKSCKDEQKVKHRREKTRLKVQAWRKKQRENKAKYEELKKVDRERRKNARLRKRQQALSDTNILQELKKKKREEMKKYRHKKKEKPGLSLPGPKIAEINQNKTSGWGCLALLRKSDIKWYHYAKRK